jgi:TIR domain-containing protein/SIR2-like protein
MPAKSPDTGFDRRLGIVDTSAAPFRDSRMSSPLPIRPLATLDDDAWDDLLNFIEERRVIPIVGPELLKVETDTGPRLLYDWIAEKLAAKLSVDTRELPQPYTLNDVVCWFLASRGRREEAYTRVRSILRDATFEPPLALRQLAQITDFDLFVTTTFDPLLETAVNLERFQGAQSTEVIAYSPNRVADLPTERERLQRPVIYHLLGRLSASPTYVISDEDTLEFICALQSEHLTPEKLFHELEHNHLLVIGSSFTNWLAQLFLRMAKRHRLSDPRDVGEVLADNHSDSDGRLISFLQQVSMRTRIYSGAGKFVDELHRRWTVRRKPADVIALGSALQRFLPPEREMPDNAVFVSYAREDLAAVQKLKAGLDAAGITTWFDLERLESGDDYDRKIQRNIARYSYFIPIVSATTERRLEGYFRREWSYAIDRARNIAEGALFMLPVSIDDTDAGGAQVPERFKALHFTKLPGGEVSPEFARRLQDLLAARRT